ncbi:LITAF-like zinc ribbon domain-containing protein [Tricharina praecox]|uniref:LITAF-like zinc ribbon domain-containing protein n=1 Tax=Tricharina praecox TaxID=43433 RepID=UPI0022205F06|nr:LITAF-like zinc ribbon domain-containing protein [Tricharina praecox]KAI5859128.1 LITAF-like zinc ribbon domain-containing protein [Tricharina praecox]
MQHDPNAQQQQQYVHDPSQPMPVSQTPAPMYGEKAPDYHLQPQQTGAQGHQFLTAMPLASLSRSPAPVDCPSCGARALTACSYQSGDNAHLWALIFCCLLCAPCVPYVVKSFKDVQHSCGNCAVPLALWHKSGGVDVLIHA